MASTKKTGQLVTVDARKLGLGIKTTLEGMAMVFDSLGVDAGFEVKAEASVKKGTAKAEKKTEATEDIGMEKAGDEAEGAVADTTGDVAADDVGDADVSADEASDKVDAEADATASKASTVSTVSLDDVTKIIVQKIKQDRSNNEKIGQILKTYGAAKVGELDSAKYEAFLTDVAAL